MTLSHKISGQENTRAGDIAKVAVLASRELATIFKILGFSESHAVQSKEEFEKHLSGLSTDTIIITTGYWLKTIERLSEYPFTTTLPESMGDLDDTSDIDAIKQDVIGMKTT
ncbi:MAG: hypothetical protein ACOCU6_00930 [Nanoarchaeota archaeon]